MNSTTRRSLKIFASALVLLAAAGSLALADTAIWSTTLAGPLAGGTAVQVGVSNLGNSPGTGVVSVEAVVDGMPVTGYATVSLLPGQSTVVVVAFAAPVQGVLDVATASSQSSPITMGMIGDEANPF